MRPILLIFFCCIGISSSAQWWKFKKPVQRPAPIERGTQYWPAKFIQAVNTLHPQIRTYTLPRTAYNLELNELSVMRAAQHNMRFQIYDQASYDFSELAQLYVLQNRFSEAKWYFLQSIFLSRRQNNYKLTISTLKKLAAVKAQIGDYILARQDLLEARDIASSCGWLVEVIEAEKKLSQIQHSSYASLRSNIKYAEVVEQDSP